MFIFLRFKKILPSFYPVFLIFLVLLFQQKVNAQSQKPNIIFILGDDIGYKTLNINGGQSFNTPNLDAMAKAGMNFTECHAAPLCSPSRFMLLTGKYNFRNYTEWGNMDTSQKTIGNMFKDAGYKTAYFGKWQLNGGEASVKKFGFDNYCIWLPFTGSEPSRYKNPSLYANGDFVPDSLTLNKYGEDVVADSVMNFIERNKSVPFFVYYPMLLAHPPFQPTPDDAAYASWDFPVRSDTSFYASMIEYMDKKIGQVRNKVKQLGLGNNTIIIYVGDNGTPQGVAQRADDSTILGGKGLSLESGIHVPMIIDWPQIIKPGSTNSDLIGFTDFLPTLAHVANIPIPSNYGPLDGVDFYPQLKDNKGMPRDWLFYHFVAHPGVDSLKRWAETKEYKLYDTSLFNPNRAFYNIQKDPKELDSLPNNALTPDELLIKQKLLKVMNVYVKQGVPILSNADMINISDSSAILEDSVQLNGGSTIKMYGAVWDVNPNPVYPSALHTDDGPTNGPYHAMIKGLKTNSVYYARAYAKNIAGISYSNQIKFRTLLNTPKAFAATAITGNRFIANWHPITAATKYKLYVSTKPEFITVKPGVVDQQFNNGIAVPDGWTFIGSIGENDTIHNGANPAIQFKSARSQVITKLLSGPATQLKFWIRGLGTDTSSYLRVEAFDGTKWMTIKYIQLIPENGITKTFDSSSLNTPLPGNIIQFRFTYFKSKGTLAFDNVYIKYNTTSNAFIKGYNGLIVNDTSYRVTGLKAGTAYYYRVKAINSYNTSDNSNVIPVTTCASQNCDQPIGADNINSDELNNVQVFPNPSSSKFILTVQNTGNKQIEIFVTDVYGKKMYQTSGNSTRYLFGKKFGAGVYFVHITQGKTNKTFKLIKAK